MEEVPCSRHPAVGGHGGINDYYVCGVWFEVNTSISKFSFF